MKQTKFFTFIINKQAASMWMVLLGYIAAGTMSAWPEMRCEFLNADQGLVRLTYEIKDDRAGNKIFLFPAGGFIHDVSRGVFKVESVFDVDAKQEQAYKIVRDKETGLPQLRISYPQPIAKDKKKILQITVQANLPKKNLFKDDLGRYLFQYQTSHAFELLVPEDQYIVYSNLPVLLFEKGSHIIVQQLDTKSRNIVIQTRLKKK